MNRDLNAGRPGSAVHALALSLAEAGRGGAEQVLDRLSEVLTLELGEVPDGSRVLDWTVPPNAALSYGEVILTGEAHHAHHEVLLVADVAEAAPGGAALLALLGQTLLARRGLRRSYRLLFAPGDLGMIAWLARNETRLGRIKTGLVLQELSAAPLAYQAAPQAGSTANRLARLILKDMDGAVWGAPLPWSPLGSQRHFGMPGVALPLGCLRGAAQASAHASQEGLEAALAFCLAFVEGLEHDVRYRNVVSKGEPDLARRGVLSRIRASGEPEGLGQAVRWLIALSDGQHSLLDVAECSGLGLARIKEARGLLLERGLLARADEPALQERGRRLW